MDEYSNSGCSSSLYSIAPVSIPSFFPYFTFIPRLVRFRFLYFLGTRFCRTLLFGMNPGPNWFRWSWMIYRESIRFSLGFFLLSHSGKRTKNRRWLFRYVSVISPIFLVELRALVGKNIICHVWCWKLGCSGFGLLKVPVAMFSLALSNIGI